MSIHFNFIIMWSQGPPNNSLNPTILITCKQIPIYMFLFLDISWMKVENGFVVGFLYFLKNASALRTLLDGYFMAL